MYRRIIIQVYLKCLDHYGGFMVRPGLRTLLLINTIYVLYLPTYLLHRFDQLRKKLFFGRGQFLLVARTQQLLNYSLYILNLYNQVVVNQDFQDGKLKKFCTEDPRSVYRQVPNLLHAHADGKRLKTSMAFLSFPLRCKYVSIRQQYCLYNYFKLYSFCNTLRDFIIRACC